MSVLLLAQAGLIPSPDINPIGYRMGWALWPVNFDPVWIESCPYHQPAKVPA